jgi:hypothetical protein
MILTKKERRIAMKTLKLFLSALLIQGMVSACLIDTPEQDFVNPYRKTIVGFWKLQNVVYNYDNEREVSVEFNDNPIVYEFTDKNKLIVTGSESILPDDISILEGEYDYEYRKPNVGILALPAPNFRIDQREPLYCLALANDNIMTLGGEIFDRQLEKTVRWNKTFVKQD